MEHKTQRKLKIAWLVILLILIMVGNYLARYHLEVDLLILGVFLTLTTLVLKFYVWLTPKLSCWKKIGVTIILFPLTGIIMFIIYALSLWVSTLIATF